jgi:hypothetical protein
MIEGGAATGRAPVAGAAAEGATLGLGGWVEGECWGCGASVVSQISRSKPSSVRDALALEASSCSKRRHFLCPRVVIEKLQLA